MHSTSRREPQLYSPIPGVIPGEIRVSRPPVAPQGEKKAAAPTRAPRPVRSRRQS